MIPDNPELWARVRSKWKARRLPGNPSGQWGARKVVLARLDYARQGGDWRADPEPGGVPQ